MSFPIIMDNINTHSLAVFVNFLFFFFFLIFNFFNFISSLKLFTIVLQDVEFKTILVR